VFQMSLDLAVKLGLLQKNVAKQVGNVKKNKKKVDFWTQSEFEKVIATFDTSDYYQNYSFMLIWLLFMTGLRFGEAQALEWDNHIDFENKTLRVNKSMYYKNAEEYYITEPKTTASNRVIAIDSDTIRYLKNWKMAQENCGGSKWILSYNGLPTNKSAPYHIIQRHSELAGVHRIKTHALRPSHASLLISLGENAIVMRDRLGHEDIKTTLGTYGHLYPNTIIEVVDRLVGLINVETNEKAIKEQKNLVETNISRKKENKKWQNY
ncbi:site-specific integrase, partial [Listeria monocytogenes]|nr:site-specific integrase [Listeria monocytogenes]EAG7320729.1 site-specific integrase [Listeria monocytogenes]EGP7102911.1 site-specific integrase [Listeria monocytogenes]